MTVKMPNGNAHSRFYFYWKVKLNVLSEYNYRLKFFYYDLWLQHLKRTVSFIGIGMSNQTHYRTI